MKGKIKTLLIVDGIVNLILGILLILFPFGIAQVLGVPQSISNFYPTILGAVLFGIGILVDSILTVFYAFRVLFPKSMFDAITR